MSLTEDLKALFDRRTEAVKSLTAIDDEIGDKQSECQAALDLISGKIGTLPTPKPKKAQAPRGSVEKAVREYLAGHPEAAAEDIARIEQLNLGSVHSALRKIKNEKPAPTPASGQASPGFAPVAPLFTSLEPKDEAEA